MTLRGLLPLGPAVGAGARGGAVRSGLVPARPGAAAFGALEALLVLPGPARDAAAGFSPGSVGRDAVTLGLLVTALTGLTVCLRAGRIARLLREGGRAPGTVAAVRPDRARSA